MTRATARAAIALALLAVATLQACSLVGGGTASVPPSPRPPPPPIPAPTPAPTPSTRPPDAQLLQLPDAVPKHETRGRLGNPPFYEVAGLRYVVLPESRGYVERGVASWYGDDFHGGRTSIGEPYDMYGMTAAHKTLPLPAYARVTNLKNGRSIVVRVNDRGPFKPNRIIDLSYTAALKLDMIRDGTTLVEVRALEPDGVAPPPPPPATLYAQAGAFGVEANARRLQQQLASAGLDDASVLRDTRPERVVWRVRIGPIANVAAYDAVVTKLRALGHTDVRLAAE